MVDKPTATWTVWDARSNVLIQEIFNIDLYKYIDKVGEGSFYGLTSMNPPTDGSDWYIDVYCQYNDWRALVMSGRITECKPLTTGQFLIRMEEYAGMLKQYYLKGGDHLITRNIISHSKFGFLGHFDTGRCNTIGDYIDIILEQLIPPEALEKFTFEVHDWAGVLDIYRLPIEDEEQVCLPDLNFSYMTVAGAFKRIIGEWCGENFWFECYWNGSKIECHIYIGELRKEIPGSLLPMIISTKATRSSVLLQGITEVLVKSTESNASGRVGAPGKSAAYEIKGAYTEAELKAFAARILADIRTEDMTFVSAFPPWYVFPMPFDAFNKIGDCTLDPDHIESMRNMPWERYLIRECHFTDTQAEYTFGNKFKNIFLAKQVTLKQIDGVSEIPEDRSKKAGIVDVPMQTNQLVSDTFTLPVTSNETLSMMVTLGSVNGGEDPELEPYGDPETDPYNPAYQWPQEPIVIDDGFGEQDEDADEDV